MGNLVRKKNRLSFLHIGIIGVTNSVNKSNAVKKIAEKVKRIHWKNKFFEQISPKDKKDTEKRVTDVNNRLRNYWGPLS